MKTKEQRIEEYKTKGVEWLAKRLASVTDSCYRLEAELNKVYKERSEAEAKAHHILQENANLAEVLQANGIRPKQLIVEYLERDCGRCNHGVSYDGDEDYSCGDPMSAHWGECEYKAVIETVSFYTFRIDGESIEGIISDFSDSSFDVVSVKDAVTGETIYEASDDDKEDDGK